MAWRNLLMTPALDLETTLCREGTVRMAINRSGSSLSAWYLRLLCGCVIFALAACTDVSMTASPLTAAEAPAEIYVLDQPVTAAPAGGQSRTLRAGSRWALVGTITQGMALRPINAVLTAEGTNVYEAYLVVHDGTWVGFWLPYGQTFSPTQTQARIQIRKE